MHQAIILAAALGAAGLTGCAGSAPQTVSDRPGYGGSNSLGDGITVNCAHATPFAVYAQEVFELGLKRGDPLRVLRDLANDARKRKDNARGAAVSVAVSASGIAGGRYSLGLASWTLAGNPAYGFDGWSQAEVRAYVEGFVPEGAAWFAGACPSLVADWNGACDVVPGACPSAETEGTRA